ncbi:hypothetical protein XA68_18044 [Ophiocordyceps unilateralis]|uniref:ABM domain-containing protein n=1 Tax=Ophiocordyceps unilateralis TaxID=268505 RepID=A0A2A9PJE6_OPHUN|nr:hypothetical protein XA68_18044 [Ophiocordyceps unilateralis]
MPVTEFALLRLQSGFDKDKLLQVLARCRDRQDEWMRHQQPQSFDGSLSTMYLGRIDDAWLVLITAPWDSPEAHADWICTEANRACNEDLDGFVDSVDLVHLESVGTRAQLRGPFLSGRTFSVLQYYVSSGGRDALVEAYRSLEENQDELWAGLRVERNGEADETLVVFTGGKVELGKPQHLIQSSDDIKVGVFRHVV